MDKFTYEPIVVPPGFPPQQGVRRSDGSVIPADPANTDWQAYQAWLEAGNALTPTATVATKP